MAALNIDRFLGISSGQSNLQSLATSRNSLANFVGQNSLANYIGVNADPFSMELKEPSPEPVRAPRRRQANARRPRNNANPGSMNQNNAASPSNIDFQSMKVKDLKEVLKAHGVKQSGRKNELIARCFEFKLDLIAPMNVAALKEQLRAREMAIGGNKNELRARLVKALSGGGAKSKSKGSGKKAPKKKASGSSGRTGIGSLVVNIH